MTNYSRYILRGSSATFVIRIFGLVIGFALQVLLARVLDEKEYGVYTYLFGLLTPLSAFPRLGLPSVLPRFLTVMNAEQKWGEVKGTLLIACTIPLVCSLLASVGVYGIELLYAGDPDAKYIPHFWSLAILLPFFTITPLLSAALLSFKKVLQSEVPLNVLRPVLILAGVGACYYTLDQVRATHVMLVMTFAIGVTVVFSIKYIIFAIPRVAWKAQPVYRISSIFKIAMPLMLMASFSAIFSQFTVICLGWFAPEETVGLFGACTRIALLVAFALQAVDTVLHPLIAEMYHLDKHEELQRTISYSARIITAVTFASFIMLALSGKFVLGVFGESYKEGYYVLLILLGAQVIDALCGTNSSIMKMTNHHNQACLILMVGAIANIILCLVLIPALGIYGAAIAVILTMLIWNGTMVYYVVRKIGLNPTALPLFDPKMHGLKKSQQ